MPDSVTPKIVEVVAHHRLGGNLGARMAALENDHITRRIAASGLFYEVDLLDAIATADRTGVYIDVGAHIGNHSVFFKLHCPSTAVYAFECNPKVIIPLATNAKRFGFTVHFGVVSYQAGLGFDVVDAVPGNHGMARPITGSQFIGCRLDDFGRMWASEPVAVLKIDVEGGEAGVLRSAHELIKRDTPLIAAEAMTEVARDAIDRALAPYGYQRRPEVYCATPTYLWEVP